MKVFYVYNSTGVNEIYNPKDLGVENVPLEEWKNVEGFESSIIKHYSTYDGVGRIVVEDTVSEEEMLDELENVDEYLW